MNLLITTLTKLGVLKDDLDYHLIRASMVIVFFFFGYQKWFNYEAQALIPYFSHGPLIFWMLPAFGIKGAAYFLGVAEWLFGALLLAGFWNKTLGIHRRNRFVCLNDYDPSLYSERLGGVGWGLPGNDRNCRFPHEGFGSACRILLSLDTRCCESGT